MKQLKFLMVALTLLMGISFTSCLNSDNDYAPTVGGFVKVGGGMFGTTFTMLDGATTISPDLHKLILVGVPDDDLLRETGQMHHDRRECGKHLNHIVTV